MNSSSSHNLSTHMSARRSRSVRRGFTLIEVMVVLAIAAVVTSITVSGFRSLTDGNQRTTCQTNMSQLYASLRLYAADEGGAFPYYNRDQEDDTNNDDGRGIGLWALYTFPLETDADKLAPVQPAPDSKPIERYLRSANVLHCPADFDAELEDGTTVNRESLFLPDPDTPTQRIYNPDYISYHSFDNGTPDDNGDDVSLYASFRLDRDDPKPTSVSGLERWRRQLLHYDDDTFINRRPTDDTVVTWCPWHRGVRDFDNVLFYDGSIQILPRLQTIEDGVATNASCAEAADDCLEGSDRRPVDPK
jgi:prepilin-type N-terminal cleavage/methylation domain-containing protein